MFTAAPSLSLRNCLAVCLLPCCWATTTHAQFELPTGLSGFGSQADAEEVAVSAEFIEAKDDQPAQLSVTAVIPEGFHVYAIDQGVLPDNGGGPMATQINVDASAPVKLLGPWQPDTPPKTHIDEEAWIGLNFGSTSTR